MRISTNLLIKLYYCVLYILHSDKYNLGLVALFGTSPHTHIFYSPAVHSSLEKTGESSRRIWGRGIMCIDLIMCLLCMEDPCTVIYIVGLSYLLAPHPQIWATVDQYLFWKILHTLLQPPTISQLSLQLSPHLSLTIFLTYRQFTQFIQIYASFAILSHFISGFGCL